MFCASSRMTVRAVLIVLFGLAWCVAASGDNGCDCTNMCCPDGAVATYTFTNSNPVTDAKFNAGLKAAAGGQVLSSLSAYFTIPQLPGAWEQNVTSTLYFAASTVLDGYNYTAAITVSANPSTNQYDVQSIILQDGARVAVGPVLNPAPTTDSILFQIRLPTPPNSSFASNELTALASYAGRTIESWATVTTESYPQFTDWNIGWGWAGVTSSTDCHVVRTLHRPPFLINFAAALQFPMAGSTVEFDTVEAQDPYTNAVPFTLAAVPNLPTLCDLTASVEVNGGTTVVFSYTPPPLAAAP